MFNPFGRFMACLILVMASLHAQTATPAMESTFLAKLKGAVAGKDFASFSALICHDGTSSAEHTAALEKVDHDLFGQLTANPGIAYAFAPVPANQLTSYVYQGKTYVMNLKPVGIMQISFSPPPANGALGMSFPLGAKDGGLLIVQTEEKTP